MTLPHHGHLRNPLAFLPLLALAASIAFAAPASRPATRPTTHAMRSSRSFTTQPTAAEIESLIQKLGGDDHLERDRAQDRLIKLGGAVEQRLRRLLKESTDEEVISRAQAVVRLIGEDRLAGPTFVTVHFNDADPEEVFRELGKQVRFDLLPEPKELWTQKQWPRVTLSADHEPFWTVMLNICRQLSIEPDVSDYGRLRVADTGGDWAHNPSVVGGPVIIQAEEITLTKTVKFTQPANREQTTQLTLNAFAEPHLRVLPHGYAAVIHSVVDEKGNSLQAADHAEPTLNPIGSDTGRAWDLDVELTNPPNVGTKIAALKGSLHFMVPVKLETLEVPDILRAKDLNKVVAGRRILIRKAHKVQGGYAVDVTLFRDGLEDYEWEQMSDPHDFVRLVDDKNQSLNFTGIAESDNGDKQITLSLRFENPGQRPQPHAAIAAAEGAAAPALKLVWDIPLEGKEISIPFELKDLPLP